MSLTHDAMREVDLLRERARDRGSREQDYYRELREMHSQPEVLDFDEPLPKLSDRVFLHGFDCDEDRARWLQLEPDVQRELVISIGVRPDRAHRFVASVRRGLRSALRVARSRPSVQRGARCPRAPRQRAASQPAAAAAPALGSTPPSPPPAPANPSARPSARARLDAVCADAGLTPESTAFVATLAMSLARSVLREIARPDP